MASTSTTSLSFMVENGLNLSEVLTTGSILHINDDYDEVDNESEQTDPDSKTTDIIGQPVPNFDALAKRMIDIDKQGYVKKKILNEGGGLPLHAGCTVSIAYSGYFENHPQPFDVVSLNKPMVDDLADSSLLPGLVMALKSMLVGEISIFLLSYKVMYGEMGIPPRIRPKADCVFYIKLVKSILTPKEGKINFSEPNMFQRVNHEVKLLHASGSTLCKNNNYIVAINLFKKAVNMLHKCRLADENEEQIQEKLLKKLYINLAICYNKVKKPLMACTACNELNRLNNLWNNGKALLQNAKALRMIGEYNEAERKLQRAIKITGGHDILTAEYELLKNAKQASENSKSNAEKITSLAAIDIVCDAFKLEVDNLISKFKENPDEGELLLPRNLKLDELLYVKQACIRENLFFNQIAVDEDEVSENAEVLGDKSTIRKV